MPVRCCILGCYTNVDKHKDVLLYRFPDNVTERELRKRWIEAVKIANSEKFSWQPNSTSRLCSKHFEHNRRSFSPSNPNSVPTIFPAVKPEASIEDIYDSETCSVDYESESGDSEVIQETSDCIFVVEKIKQEIEDEDHASEFKCKSNGRKTGKANRKRKSSKSAVKNEYGPNKKNKLASRHSEKELLQSKALFTGKFSSDSSDSDFDEDEFQLEGEVADREFLSIADKVKVELKGSAKTSFYDSDIESDDYDFSSDDGLLLEKESPQTKPQRAESFAKGSQVTLPGVCDGFVFCTSRDDDSNVGVQCNIFLELKPTLNNVEETGPVTCNTQDGTLSSIM